MKNKRQTLREARRIIKNHKITNWKTIVDYWLRMEELEKIFSNN